MWLDGFDTLDSEEGATAESGGEQQSEAARAKAAKALAGIQRTKRDEKKAQRDNDYLYLCLRDIITSEKYDGIIPYIFPLFDAWVPSHIVIGSFSLIHKQASDIIRDHYTSDSANKSHRAFSLSPYSTPVEFDDETIDPLIRKRVNEWIEDIFSVISHDPSFVMTERFLSLLSGKTKKDITRLLTEIFVFFLGSLNMHISETKASLYTDFILQEVEKKVRGLKLEIV